MLWLRRKNRHPRSRRCIYSVVLRNRHEEGRVRVRVSVRVRVGVRVRVSIRVEVRG